VHNVDDDRSPVPELAHHVRHVSAADRVAALVELTCTPGRKVLFTRTKRRARLLAHQLMAAGVPAMEMHSNLGQAARIRDLNAISSGRANVLVATDIAGRGLHVDDVRLVIHADPPLEHKTYLHRSGRTAPAGAGGTAVTLGTEDQRAEVTKLARRAGVTPRITQHRPGQRILRHLVPNETSCPPRPPRPLHTTTGHRIPLPLGRLVPTAEAVDRNHGSRPTPDANRSARA
jgi:superfamily II DNA/RNA helicase